MAQVLLVADSPGNQAVRLAGQPASAMGAWLLDIPVGQTALQYAATWAKTQTFQIGTIMYVLDPSGAQKFTLQADWVPG